MPKTNLAPQVTSAFLDIDAFRCVYDSKTLIFIGTTLTGISGEAELSLVLFDLGSRNDICHF